MNFELEPTKTKKKDNSKIIKELVRLNLLWWKNHGDDTIFESFCTHLAELGSESMEVAESYFLHLNTWARKHDFDYQRLHRFQIRLSIGETVIDIKINDLDYEFYLLVNDMPKKLFKSPREIEPWIQNEFLDSMN
ncbi:hypothetical protein [Paenibacillus sp. P13VS]|uniref:hypothetical protein n=1 Tax=Paenibacillus sp. P13VS TaxID=2697367 RepID=UPI00187BAB93|nr:hypothetical protein [Paenibacillus sp. P13VS]MBE7682222.1 hypothetical protein [Paenibacillus sp. P13VS]